MKVKALKLYETIVVSALQHGQDSEPDHEVGDLQSTIEECFNIMTPSQINYLKQVLVDKELISE